MIQEHIYTNSDSTAMINLLVSKVDNAILMLDAKQRIVSCNALAQSLYGVTEQQVSGQPRSAVYTIDQFTSKDEQHIQDQLQATGSWRGVQQHRTRNAHLLTIDTSMQLLPHNSAGAHMLLILRDLGGGDLREFARGQHEPQSMALHKSPAQHLFEQSAQYQTEVQLQRSIEQLQLALTALDGFIYDYDIQQDSIEYSAGLTQLLGYQQAHLPRHAQWWINLVHPRDREGLPLARRLNREAQSSYSHEYRVRHKNGHYIHVWDRAILIRNIQGDPIRLIGTTINLTERKQAEERQRYLTNISKILADSIEYEARLGEFVRLTVLSIADWCVIDLIDDHDEIVPIALAHHDPEKELLLHELCQRFPIHRTELAGTSLILRTGESQWYPLVTEALLQNTMEAHELQLWQAIGYHSLMIVPLVRRKKVIGLFTLMLSSPERAYMLDDLALAELAARRITIAIDNAQLYRKQQEAVNVRDVFLLTASHELKTPLTAILGQAQLLQQRLEQSNTATERNIRTIRVIVEQARRLNKLIHTLLDVSRLSQGQLQIVREPVQLNQLLRRIVEDFQLLLVQHTVSYQEPDQQLVVDGDALRLEQVFQNLLQNALKYSPQGGLISVNLAEHAAEALITVHDHGIGIPQEALPSLFQRFYRVNNVASQDMSGIGVGLYVVREIVTLHGGSVRVESTEGQGSSFIISLPLANAPTAGQVLRDQDAPVTSTSA